MASTSLVLNLTKWSSLNEMPVCLQRRSVAIKDRCRNNGTARDGNRKSRSVERMRRHGAPSSVKDEAVTAGGDADS